MAETRIRQRVVETNGVTYTELAYPNNTSQFLRGDGNWVTAGGGGGGGASAISLSAGTSSASLASVVFSNSNGVSFGLNGSTVTASHNGLSSQSNQAMSAGNGSFAFQTASFVNSNGISFSTTAGSAIVASHNALTSQSNQALSAANGSFTFQTATFANSNGVSFSTGTQGLFASHNGITSQSNQQMTAFAVSNTTQSSSGTFNASSLQFAGAGGVSVGVSNGSVVISGATGGGGGGGSVNFSAGTASGNLASVVFSNSNGVSFGLNGSTITASAAGGGGGAPSRSYIEIMQGERMTSAMAASATQWSRRPVLLPFWLDGTGIQCKTVRFIGSGVGSSNRSLQMSLSVGIYYATNSTQLSLLASDSQGFSITASSQSSLWNGGAIIDFTGMSTLTLSNEGRYVLALDVSASAHNATFASFQFWGGDLMPNFSRFLVGGTTSATNNTSHVSPFWGVYSTTTNAMPSTIGATQINGGNSASLVDLYAIIKQI